MVTVIDAWLLHFKHQMWIIVRNTINHGCALGTITLLLSILYEIYSEKVMRNRKVCAEFSE